MNKQIKRKLDTLKTNIDNNVLEYILRYNIPILAPVHEALQNNFESKIIQREIDTLLGSTDEIGIKEILIPACCYWLEREVGSNFYTVPQVEEKLFSLPKPMTVKEAITETSQDFLQSVKKEKKEVKKEKKKRKRLLKQEETKADKERKLLLLACDNEKKSKKMARKRKPDPTNTSPSSNSAVSVQKVATNQAADSSSTEVILQESTLSMESTLQENTVAAVQEVSSSSKGQTILQDTTKQSSDITNTVSQELLDSFRSMQQTMESFQQTVQQDISSLKQDFKSFQETVQQDISSLKKDFKSFQETVQQDIASLKQDVSSTNRNIGCLYELMIENNEVMVGNASKVAYVVKCPLILYREQFTNEFDQVESKRYASLLKHLINSKVISVENGKALNLKTDTIELNFVRKKKHEEETTSSFTNEAISTFTKGTDVHIIEATMSSFTNKQKLICKLLQLERQVLYFRACFPKSNITRIGLISPSGLTLKKVKQMVASYPKLINIKYFLDKCCFDVIKFGYKSDFNI